MSILKWIIENWWKVDKFVNLIIKLGLKVTIMIVLLLHGTPILEPMLGLGSNESGQSSLYQMGYHQNP